MSSEGARELELCGACRLDGAAVDAGGQLLVLLVILGVRGAAGASRGELAAQLWPERPAAEAAPLLDPLRAFHERQLLAKRLWLYLAAERWKKTGSATEGTWITCGDRLYAALGMGYAQHRFARRALKNACHTVRKVDPRYSAGQLDLIKVGSSYRIQGSRPTWKAWKVGHQGQLRIREEIRRSIRSQDV